MVLHRGQEGVLIAFPRKYGKIRCQDISSVFSAKTQLIESVCGREDNPVVEIQDQPADFLHVFP